MFESGQQRCLINQTFKTAISIVPAERGDYGNNPVDRHGQLNADHELTLPARVYLVRSDQNCFPYLQFGIFHHTCITES